MNVCNDNEPEKENLHSKNKRNLKIISSTFICNFNRPGTWVERVYGSLGPLEAISTDIKFHTNLLGPETWTVSPDEASHH